MKQGKSHIDVIKSKGFFRQELCIGSCLLDKFFLFFFSLIINKDNKLMILRIMKLSELMRYMNKNK